MRITYCTHLPSILSRLSAVFSQLCTSYPPCHTKLSVAHVSRSYKILIRLFCSWVTQIFIKHKEGTNHNRLHYDQTRCKRPCIFLAHSATVYPLLSFVSLFPSAIYPSIHPQSSQRDLMLYIFLCPSSMSCKVKKMNVSPGKIHRSSVYSPGPFTVITLPGQVYTPFFISSLLQFSTISLLFSISFLQL